MPFGFRNSAPLNTPVIRIFKQILGSLLLLNSCVFAMSSSLRTLWNDPLALPSELPAEGQAGSGGARTTFIIIRQHRQEDKGLWGGEQGEQGRAGLLCPRQCCQNCDVTLSHSLSALIRTELHKASSTSCLWVSADLCQRFALPSWYGHNRAKNWFWFLPCLGLKPCRTRDECWLWGCAAQIWTWFNQVLPPLSSRCQITV